MSDKIEAGDLVQVKSGGPLMTVAEIAKDGTEAKCLHEEFLPIHVLRVVERVKQH